MRRGFTLLSAIFLMVLVAVLMMLTFSLSTQTTKQTADLYLQEQAQLLAKSSTEFALLAISGHDNRINCINSMTLNYNRFKISMNMRYIGAGMPAGCNTISNTITTPESNGTVLIDTIVSYTDPDTNETVRYHRRTIQKP
ncbi:MAG: type II secretion system protein [Hydrogenimonas sp.]|nr:type II secretion system protein [Hydrogenimonas sp.]